MNNKIWIISDTHFNHKAILDFENRPKDYQEQIMRKWNNNVAEEDIIIHLGDVIFDKQSKLKDILSSLKGKKILVRGNHDRRSYDFYINKGFDFIVDEFKLRYNNYNIIFSHKPKIPLDIGYINIHGHLHSKSYKYIRENLSYKHLLYSAELENYMPILLHNMLDRLNTYI